MCVGTTGERKYRRWRWPGCLSVVAVSPVGNSTSRMVEVRTGLRQGGALSPILFNLVLEKVIQK